MIDVGFWSNKKVLVTGHTGFKGSWLSIWLYSMGAKVMGYSLEPPTEPSLYKICRVDELVVSHIGDIRDKESLITYFMSFRPEIVIHMAAQPIVRESYKNPVGTYEINVMGTVNLLEAVRMSPGVKAVINVTTDKCYENKEWVWGYRELDQLGGYDPYSNSKACSELITESYRSSFFNPNEYDTHGVAIATARAGNVIGGGDWATDRLIPDCIKALLSNNEILVRNPNSVRPWQHVLEPLSGYLILAQKLFEQGPEYSGAWNFGPEFPDARPVSWIVSELCRLWGKNATFRIDKSKQPHEANYLRLDCSKAKQMLGWSPRWDIETALKKVVDWTLEYKDGLDPRESCIRQINEYLNT
ncbi:CDP-glucose 4,6-dehydratase [Clostridium thermosuccinogenes]|uniref:CDP-glucose 4,6-dehydratase n=2 Tax=Clostridium thermosuccinogenes TaxID=84032 RepID=A0A2K2FK82_9CLOT|nr:CDP-glucose 4,6-dehydratase [Pseudoclostridium thermosuccinogenes]AUS95092.1 CDP-glucose 4,6-dehydratase [Pseudoclostridium thermosuccinogenes]PNT99188.1 CDP-glucose 4,6-dehydratase [Pseudoclostridium thermosuccinogenes]PNU00991.1 CDP-glucose 4,6-dehydratase [Pseudoclostridium thermosuccinogenes]